MLDPKKCHQAIDDLTKKLSVALIPERLKEAKSDAEKTIYSILQSAFSKLDLVTREEFDVQAAVLAKTRGKLAILEDRVEKMEIKTGVKTHDPISPSEDRDND
ncbi:MAG: accessory factor UbiK family protein [Gammaproteobacteria bacterium]|nr:accessory factor UbiK family protein [Gammaproteobacteria bacterium]